MASSDKIAGTHVEQTDVSIHTIDDKPKGDDIGHARQLAQQYVPGSPEEKALVRKLDYRLLVCATVTVATQLIYSSHVSGSFTSSAISIGPISGTSKCVQTYLS